MGMFKKTAMVAVFVVAGTVGASATVAISVDLAKQRMHVVAGNGQTFDWAISSARAGYVTPTGAYAPTSLQVMHLSKKYNNSPMPHSIFFTGGYAIHGTRETAELGRPASHGCIRLAPAHATILYDLVKTEGATIEVAGAPPVGGAAERSGKTPSRHVAATVPAPEASDEAARKDVQAAPVWPSWPFGGR